MTSQLRWITFYQRTNAFTGALLVFGWLSWGLLHTFPDHWADAPDELACTVAEW